MSMLPPPSHRRIKTTQHDIRSKAAIQEFRIPALNKQDSAATFSKILAAWAKAYVWAADSISNEVVVGVALHGRDAIYLPAHIQATNLVGNFVQSIPVVCNTEPRHRSLSEHVESAFVNAEFHSSLVPFHEVRKSDCWKVSDSDLFDTFVSFNSLTMTEHGMASQLEGVGGITKSTSTPDVESMKQSMFDVALEVNEVGGGGLVGRIVYNSGSFEPNLIGKLAQQFNKEIAAEGLDNMECGELPPTFWSNWQANNPLETLVFPEANASWLQKDAQPSGHSTVSTVVRNGRSMLEKLRVVSGGTEDGITMAAFSALLWKLTGSATDDVTIGLRLSRGIIPVICRHGYGAHTSFAEHVRMTSYELNMALDRGKPGIKGTMDENPVLPHVQFILGSQEDHLGDASDMPGALPQVEIALYLKYTCEGHLNLTFHYDTTAHQLIFMEKIAERFGVLLSAASSQYSLPLLHTTWMSADELEQNVVQFNRSVVERPMGKLCLHDLMVASAQRKPDATAFVFEDDSITYQELDTCSAHFAQHLKRQGVIDGVRVALAIPKQIEQMVALLAVLRCGGAYVPVAADGPEDRLLFILDYSSASALVIGPSFTPAGVQAVKAAGHSLIQCPVWRDLIKSPSSMWLGSERFASDLAQVDTSAMAYIIYTSGSTGKPKGVACTHAGAVNDIMQWTEPGFYTEEDLKMTSNTIAYTFDFSVEELFTTLHLGGCAVMSKSIFEVIEKGTALTCIQGTPSMIATMPSIPPTVRCISVGGEAITHACIQRCAEHSISRIYNGYGPTENSINSTLWCVDLSSEFALCSIGFVNINTTAYVVVPHQELPDDLQLSCAMLCPVGMPGELVVGGKQVALGYLNRDDLNRKVFVPDPYRCYGASMPDVPASSRLYRTGDLVRRLPEGDFEFLGRIDSQVKLRGFRIELGEIDNVVTSAAAHEISACATLVCNERLFTFVALKKDCKKDWQDIHGLCIAHAQAKMPRYMVPDCLLQIEELPQTASGKVDLRALKQIAAEHTIRAISTTEGHAHAETAEEKIVCCAICEVCKMEPESVSMLAKLSDLGVSSLAMVRLNTLLRKENVSVSLREVYTCETLADLATMVKSKGDNMLDEKSKGPGLSTESCGVSELEPGPEFWSRDRGKCVVGTLQLAMLASEIALGLVAFVALMSASIYYWKRMEMGLDAAASVPIDKFCIWTLQVVIFGIVMGLVGLLLFLIEVVTCPYLKPGTYSRMSFGFLLFWIEQRHVGLMRGLLHFLHGTTLHMLALRCAGFDVAPGSFVSAACIFKGRGLISVGRGSSLNHAVHLSAYRFTCDEMHVEPITIGEQVHIGCKATLSPGSRIPDGCSIAPLSGISRDTPCKPATAWRGSPAAECRAELVYPQAEFSPLQGSMDSTTNDDTSTKGEMQPLLRPTAPASPQASCCQVSWLGIACRTIVLALIGLIELGLNASMVWWMYFQSGICKRHSDQLGTWAVFACVLLSHAFIHLTLCLLLPIVVKRILIGKFKPGRFSLYSWTHQLVLLTLDLHMYALSALQSFENTPLCIWWFKGMGVTAGYDAEACPTIEVLPDLLHLGSQSFITTGVTTGSVVVHGGSIFLNTITVEDSAFIGDLSYVGPSARLETNTLLGAQSVMPESNVLPTGETWVGNPSYPIPMRSKPESGEEIDTGKGWRWAGDLGTQVWFFMVGFPLMAVFIPTFWYMRSLVGKHSAAFSSEGDPILCGLLMTLPTIIFLSTTLATMTMPYMWLVTIVFKWTVLGRLAPRQAPINSSFMARKKMVEDAVKAADKLFSPFRLCVALPIDCWYLRSLGATIGSNVWITEHDTILSWEMDLMTVGDGAILHDASLQGHTFEDKVFKLDRISVGKQTILEPSCTILQGSHIEDNVIVKSQSLVMKGEHISEHSTWAGLTAAQVL